MKAFTLIEVLLVTTIIGIFIGFASFFYSQFSRTNFMLDETAGFIVNILKIAKEKALLSEENDNWGVWLKNTTATDYLYLFKGSTSTIKEEFDLPRQVTFFDFNNQIIIFKKNTGEVTSTVIKIGFISGNNFRYINIPTSGAIIITNQ
jgi:prepilin-type N-terminal cleavage/methylation domain-containing protein